MDNDEGLLKTLGLEQEPVLGPPAPQYLSPSLPNSSSSSYPLPSPSCPLLPLPHFPPSPPPAESRQHTTINPHNDLPSLHQGWVRLHFH